MRREVQLVVRHAVHLEKIEELIAAIERSPFSE
jgi:hypothetical protein